MKIKIKERKASKKCEAKRIRREGDIPAVIYTQGGPGITVTIIGGEFNTLLRSIPKGRLSTTKFTLLDAKNKETNVIIKGIQYHPTTYQIDHIDFEVLHPSTPVSVKVPIECVGAMECIGIKLGGTLRIVTRYVRVSCLPEKMPEYFELDVRSLGIRQHKKLSEIELPAGVTPLDKLDQVAVVIAKR